ncbi:MAG: hypothetical protein C5B44_05155 [Acidobacteria bacterium]|nr:MAG: hypothetical protein C5B44_05155 [Acidobacteriota bacterium]
MTKYLGFLILFIAFAGNATARDMVLTIYDDGLSCPYECDAHVVMFHSDNGTRYAFTPDSSRSAPHPCTVGQECKICFSEDDKSCMVARYRGDGPKAGRFDFTPAFYAENCQKPDIPEALKKQCISLDNAANRLGYTNSINCFTSPNDSKCKALMENAKAAQTADIPKRNKCLSMGQDAYNRSQADPKERRANDCNYSDLRLGGKPGNRWRRLLPAACRTGTFVDQFGLDCCSADVRFAAANHPECRAFFPKQ